MATANFGGVEKSLLIHLTFVPRLMVMWAGLKRKPWIKTVLVGCLCALAVGCLCAPEPTATFGCRLTKQGDEPGDFTGCTSPITYPTLSEDTYTFEVRAEDEAANEDATPAERTFSVDTTSPRVTSLKATSVNSSGVLLRSTNFRATFSEFMNSTTLNNGNFLLYECPSTTATDCPTQITNTTVRGRRDRLKETLDPFGNTSSVLKATTRYKVTVRVLDNAGNVLDQQPAKEGNQKKVAFFTTGSG